MGWLWVPFSLFLGLLWASVGLLAVCRAPVRLRLFKGVVGFSAALLGGLLRLCIHIRMRLMGEVSGGCGQRTEMAAKWICNLLIERNLNGLNTYLNGVWAVFCVFGGLEWCFSRSWNVKKGERVDTWVDIWVDMEKRNVSIGWTRGWTLLTWFFMDCPRHVSEKVVFFGLFPFFG